MLVANYLVYLGNEQVVVSDKRKQGKPHACIGSTGQSDHKKKVRGANCGSSDLFYHNSVYLLFNNFQIPTLLIGIGRGALPDGRPIVVAGGG